MSFIECGSCGNEQADMGRGVACEACGEQMPSRESISAAPMKVTLRPPCRECPFLKKSLRGWLGPDTPEKVWAKVHSDGPYGYPCHMDTEQAIADGSDLMDPNSVEQCVGAILHAKKTGKRYSDKFKEAAREALSAILGTDGVLGIEFIKHHADEKKRIGQRT